jgi:hypothetical protein
MDKYPEGGFPLLSTIVEIMPGATNDIRMYFEQGGDYTVVINYRNRLNPNFTALSLVSDTTPEELRNSSDDYLNVMVPSDLRLLIEQDLLDSSLELARDITRDAKTNYDRVVLIERFLSGAKFEYTTNVPALSSAHPIDDFIRNVRTGHCELYASAMALMVRSLGIPARVVSGYRGGDWAEADQSYTISNNMAHLWVEVYFPDYGWITFDPSPSEAEDGMSRLESVQNLIARYMLKARILWLQNVVDYRPDESLVLMRDSAFELVGNIFTMNSDDMRPEQRVSISDRVMGILFILSLVLALGISARLVYRVATGGHRVSQLSLSADRVRAKRLYSQLLNKLDRMGIQGRNRTADELLSQLKEASESMYEELLPFVLAYQDARFGPCKLSSKEMLNYRKLIRDLQKPSQA